MKREMCLPNMRGLSALILAVSLGAPGVVGAQPGPGGPPPPPDTPWDDELDDDGSPPAGGARRAKMRERMEATQRELMRELVGLSAAKADKLVAIRRKHDEARRPLRRKAREARRDLKRRAADSATPPAALSASIDALLEARRKLRDGQDAEIAAMRAALTPTEQARLLLAMPELHRRARKMMRDARRRHLRRELERLDAEEQVEDERGGDRRGQPPRRGPRGRRGR